MPSTVHANARPVVHQQSGDRHLVYPDVCKTPPDMTPVPYPNQADAADARGGPKTVAAEGAMMLVKGAVIDPTTGDEAGAGGGVASGTHTAEATFVACSFDIKIEGRNACRAGDAMTHNRKNAGG
jgi:hypothetical protein